MKSILVVDDNEMLCRLACDLLRTEGYHAVAAPNAMQALESLESGEFDLLVTDVRMPGMDGLELARAVRSKDPRFPIIVMTAFGPVETDHITLWLPKEYLFPRLLEEVRSCLEKRERELEAHTSRS